MSIVPKRAGIGRIPLEILREIFIHCLPALPDPASENIQQLLSSVCKLWRTLVLDTPALWALLDIECTDTDLRPPLPAIRAHLQRSKTHPLSFIIRAGDSEHFYDSFPHLPTVLTALAAARQRWRHVYIELDYMKQDILDFLMLGEAPLLQDIHCELLEYQQILPIPLHMMHRCPRLESFHWKSFGSPLLQPLGDVQLTSLSLQTHLTVSECTTLLQLSPRLSSAKLYIIDALHDPPAHVTHPTLRALTATGRFSDTLLASLTLPALQDLDFTGDKMALSTEWDIIVSAFLKRSNPILHQLSLSVTHEQNHEPALLSILALTPHLRQLKLSDSRPDLLPFTSAIIHGLHPPPPPGTPLCPRLERVYIHGIWDYSDGLCGAMIRARSGVQAHANGVACLKKVHIETDSEMHDRDWADVEELRAEGMQGTVYLD
ncbi:hypothetical protein BD779DRAFT_1476119 [Infundibulicybe gibba]|nr:hypothetical protein BD779DRAFT_1476119 [Infundibulicybe gibba]